MFWHRRKGEEEDWYKKTVLVDKGTTLSPGILNKTVLINWNSFDTDNIEGKSGNRSVRSIESYYLFADSDKTFSLPEEIKK